MPERWPVTDPSRAHVGAARTVTAVACAAFPPAGDAAVLAVRERVRALGVALPARPPHRPHLTLATVRLPGADVGAVAQALAPVAAGSDPVPVTLSRVGRFGRPGALWLGPDTDVGPPALSALQADVAAALAALGPSAPSDHDRPWVAHCTLATRLHPARLREVQAAVTEGYTPVETSVAGVAVILVGGSGDVDLLTLQRLT